MIGHVTIHEDGEPEVRRDLSKVLVIGIETDLPRELLAMNDCHRVLSCLSEIEAARVARWLCEKFPVISVS